MISCNDRIVRGIFRFPLIIASLALGVLIAVVEIVLEWVGRNE